MKVSEIVRYDMISGLVFKEHESVLMIHNIENGDMYEINEIGKLIFYKLNRGISIRDIIDYLANEYDEAYEVIEENVSDFVTRFIELGIIDVYE